MGIVKAIHQTHILISLPGRLVGRVQITNVSKAYTSILQSMVEDQDLIKVTNLNKLQLKLIVCIVEA